MEKELEIHHFQAEKDRDADEVVISLYGDEPQSARNVLADDEHGIYLRYDLESDQVVGALIFHPDEWFAQIAHAFVNQDLENPDVRFFLEKKIQALAKQTSS